jgi:twinkle protein
MSVIHAPCPQCGSNNNVAIYEDGHEYCFTPGCNYFKPATGIMPTPTLSTPNEIEPVIGDYVEIKSRKIPADSNKFFGYVKGKHGNETAYFWPIYDNQRRLVGYKIRKKNKQFLMHGSNPDNRFLGQEKWGDGGKLLVIFEGEYDCLTYHAVRNNWPCVSLPNGVESGQKVIKSQLPWLLKFEQVILCYDNDEHGQKAVQRDIQLLPPRKGKIGTLESYKDANEALLAGDTKAVMSMVWNAKEYEPDGIINASNLLSEVLEDPQESSAEYPYEFLNDKLHGLRKSELCTITAGTGIGKSTFVNEIAYDLLVRQNQTVGVISLEENLRRTARRFIGINLNHPIHIDRGTITDEQIEKAFEKTLGTGRLWLYDHFGSLDCDVLLNRVRYCIVSLGCDWVIFDHLSILVSGSDESNEVKAIDRVMTKLRSLVEETGTGLLLVSHLRRPQGGKGYEDGQQTSLSSLRGSSSIACLSDICIGLERDQQDASGAGTVVRILKNRFSGWTGVAGHVKYNEKTGRMVTLEDTPSFVENDHVFIESDF